MRPCGEPLVPTGPQIPVLVFSNHAVLAGAPLRNRTVDLRIRDKTGCRRRADLIRLALAAGLGLCALAIIAIALN